MILPGTQAPRTNILLHLLLSSNYQTDAVALRVASAQWGQGEGPVSSW